MWNQLLKIGTKALNKVDEVRHNVFGTDQKAVKAAQVLDKISSKYTPIGVMEEGGMIAGEAIGGKLGLPAGLGGLLMGAVLPGGGEAKALKKLKKVNPATQAKMDARDLLVKNNRPPTREGLRNADYRGMNGDVQGGITGQPIRMENRPDYGAATFGLRPGEYKASGKNASPKNFTPHHRNGIQDAKAFLAGKTGKQADKRREDLAVGGLFLGNQGANYEPLFDGKLSSKKIKSTGINSTDHFDVHKLSEATRKRMGIKINKKDRSLDTFHGVPIKDLPESQQLALQLQLGWQDELSIDKVQNARYEAMRRATKGLTPTERRKAILETPTLFSNLSTKVE